PDTALDVLVAGEPGLALRRDGVDVVGRPESRDAHLILPRPFEQTEHQVTRALAALLVDDGVQRFQPLPGLVRVDVRQLGGKTVADDRETLSSGSHARSFTSSRGAFGRPAL